MRVTQSTMYNDLISGMNSNLADYMESVNQGATQKRINKPSDDPVGTARILGYRGSLQRNESYTANAKSAQEWLTQADTTLGNVSSVIISIKELAEQMATGTYSAEQRKAAGEEMRQWLGSILNLSNTEHAGRHIFAGQEYVESAFEEGLTVHADRLDETVDDNWFNPPAQVTGSLDYTAIVRFAESGQIPPQQGTMEYMWSTDGGETWHTGTIEEDDTYFDVDGARIHIPGSGDAANPNTMTVIKGYDNPDDPMELREGTSFFVRPTAMYQGSDNNSKATISQYGTVDIPSNVETSATGVFPDNVLVRLDNAVTWADGEDIAYSYSTDGGRTWAAGNSSTVELTPADPTATPPTTTSSATARLVVPGGFVDLSAAENTNATPPDFANSTIPVGAQLVVQPQRTNLDFEISDDRVVTVNNVGKDIFGGLYKTNGDDNYHAAFGEGDGRNLFETVGRLIAYIETNDQDGVGEALDELTEAQTTILSYDASIGGKRNRLEVTLGILENTRYNTESAVANVEDIDLTTLMINLTKQQMAYSTVLQSSSMIMNMSLTNYI